VVSLLKGQAAEEFEKKKDGLLLRNGKDLNRNFPTWRDLNSSRADLKELAAIQNFF
jgi:hypothetical protein